MFYWQGHQTRKGVVLESNDKHILLFSLEDLLWLLTNNLFPLPFKNKHWSDWVMDCWALHCLLMCQSQQLSVLVQNQDIKWLPVGMNILMLTDVSVMLSSIQWSLKLLKLLKPLYSKDTFLFVL